MIVNILLPYFQGAVSGALFILVLRQRGKTTGSDLFSAFLASMCLWGISIGLMRSSNTHDALYWEKAALVTIASTSAFFYLFTRRYTKSGNRLITSLVGSFLILTVIISPTNLLAKAISVDKFGNAPLSGILFYPWTIGIYVLIVMGVFNLYRARKSSRFYEARNRYTYIMLGASICLAGGFIDVLSIAGLPIYPGTIIGNILFVFLTSLAILRYQLFDIQSVLRGGFVYTLTGIFVAIPIVVLGAIWVFVSQYLLNLPIWVTIAPLALFIFVIPPLWSKIGSIITQQVSKEKYSFRRAIEQFSQKRVNLSELEELCLWIVEIISRAAEPKFVSLLIQDKDDNFSSVASTFVQQGYAIKLSADHPMIDSLKETKTVIWSWQTAILPQLQAMSKKQREILEEIGAELYIPLGTGKLVGIIALGPKRSGKIYSRDDVVFLTILSHDMGLELENARLYAYEKATRQELQLIDAQKTEFLHNVAHELKTPLTAIISSSEIMESQEFTLNEQQKTRLFKNITRSAWHLNRRIGELLDLARAEIGTIDLQLEVLDICQVVTEVTTQVGSLFLNKNQVLKVSSSDTVPLVKIDKDRIEQVILNLLSNANKFSPADVEITVNTKIVDDWVVVSIQDGAPLISSEDKKRLFEPYFRGGTEESKQRISGLGLGLAISRRIVVLHQGKIWVEDAEDGKGNIFAFSFPANKEGVLQSQDISKSKRETTPITSSRKEPELN